MAAVHGSKGYAAVGGSAGTATNLSTYLNTFSIASKMETADASVFGLSAKVYAAGLQDYSISMGGVWDSSTAATSMDSVLQALIGAATATPFVWGPAGSATGSVKTSGSLFLSDFSRVGPIGGVVNWTATGVVSGGIVEGSF